MIVADDLDAEIRRRERELAALKRARVDRHDAALLLLLERDVKPGVVFSAVDLIAHGRLHPELAAVVGDVTPIALGMRLARIARRPVLARLSLACVNRGEDGCNWELRVTA